MMRHVLLTGLPGVGKTTLIRAVADCLTDVHPAGFYTEEIRAQGIRKGFRLVTLDGRQQILSHVDGQEPYRVGRYRVDVAGFERLLAELDLSHAAARLIIIDEIGKMECLSKRFRDEVTALLDSSRTVIATIALKGEGFIQQVKQRPDCRLVTVTGDNREHLVDKLVAAVRESLKAGQRG
ncbi:MAG: NTPase [Nitrospirae bacterium]|nr:MAG: NTPase [Nitrospirota bacterium]